LTGPGNATYDHGKVIVMSGSVGPGVLAAYDEATGTQLWSVTLTSEYEFTAPPTASNGTVYVTGAGMDGGTLYAIDDVTGMLMWTAPLPSGDIATPTVTADGLYLTYGCLTYDFNPATGAQIWSDNPGCPAGFGTTGTYANGLYYSADPLRGNSGTTFNAETGAHVGHYLVGPSPAIGSQTGYFIDYASGSLLAVDQSAGNTLWTFPGEGSLTGSPLLVNDDVFAATASGTLYALNALDGSVLWRTLLGGGVNKGAFEQLGQSGMSAGDGLLVVPVGRTLQAFRVSNNP
jgi:outer membrane protein assembly factor BamB